jgi:hypothetical protein
VEIAGFAEASAEILLVDVADLFFRRDGQFKGSTF